MPHKPCSAGYQCCFFPHAGINAESMPSRGRCLPVAPAAVMIRCSDCRFIAHRSRGLRKRINRQAGTLCALFSVLQQSLAPAEIIVAVSSDRDILDTIRQLRSRTPIPIRLIDHPGSLSFAADLNAALPAARSEFVSFLKANCCRHGDTLLRFADTFAPGHYASSVLGTLYRLNAE